jgi:hypothetical protein
LNSLMVSGGGFCSTSAGRWMPMSVTTAQDVGCWSLWNGYLQDDSTRQSREWFVRHGCPLKIIHTSGRAAAGDLCAFATAMNTCQIIPVHGDKCDRVDLPNLRRMPNGVTVEL